MERGHDPAFIQTLWEQWGCSAQMNLADERFHNARGQEVGVRWSVPELGGDALVLFHQIGTSMWEWAVWPRDEAEKRFEEVKADGS